MKTTQLRDDSGSSMIVVLSVLATLMVVVGVAAEYTNTIKRHVQRSGTLQSAVSVGDGCIEVLFSNWRQICSSTPSVAKTTADMAAIPTPAPGQLNLPASAKFVKRGTGLDPNVDELDTTYVVSNYKIVATDAEWNGLTSATLPPEAMLGRLERPVTSGTPTPITPAIFNYVASADVTLPALGKDGYMVAKVRRVFQKQQMSPWNFAIFYVDPLEIHPGPDFTVSGWVHTNSDLYTGHSNLTFADKVTYGSDWFVNFSPNETYHRATLGETPTAPHYPGNLPPARDIALQPFGLDSSGIFKSGTPNTNDDSYHELIEPADPNFSDPIAKARYWNQADVVIEVKDNPNASVPGFDGVRGHDFVNFYTTDPSTGMKTPLTSGGLYNTLAFGSVITTNQSIQDNREGASVKLTTINVANLETGVGGSTPKWKGGLDGTAPIIYAYHASASGSARRGIRLTNGDNLPRDGVTFASANPVYIQGDYNVGNGTPPSNWTTNSDPALPQVNGYTRAPTSVVADAVTILSNNWNDSNSTGSLGGRAATNTTVNTAIVAGIVASSNTAPGASGPTSYSGGAENFPRFLEDWTNVNFTYYGSMIELYQSQQAVGRWGKDQVYGAPTRRWYFDNNFKISPPPGTVMLYSYIKGKWSVN